MEAAGSVNAKLAILNEAQEKLSNVFKALSSEALKSNNESFLNLARTTLEKFQEGARNDLEKRQTAIDQLVKPVRETLQKFDVKIGEIEKSRILALPRRVGKKPYLTELVATGQKKGVIDGLEQYVEVLQV